MVDWTAFRGRFWLFTSKLGVGVVESPVVDTFNGCGRWFAQRFVLLSRADFTHVSGALNAELVQIFDVNGCGNGSALGEVSGVVCACQHRRFLARW